MSAIGIEDVRAAAARLKGRIHRTPVITSRSFDERCGCHVFFKCENLQYTGAFKIRGALNKLLTLTAEQRSRGVVTASSGNHGVAVAYGLSKLHIPGIVFVQEDAAVGKVEKIRNYGVP